LETELLPNFSDLIGFLVMALTIPKSQATILGKLLQYDLGKLDALLRVFRSGHADLVPVGLAKELSKEAGIREKEAAQVVQVLLSVYATRSSHKAPVEQFLQEVCDAMQEMGLKPSHGNWEPFRKFLGDLLNLKGAIEVTSKAFSILIGNERNFAGARIFTDIRPVFRENPSDPPAGAVIVHTIELQYMEGHARKEFFLALDSRDLKTMKDVIERAFLKETCLLQVLAKTELAVVMPT
jgi:hypothetical protein